MSKNPRPLAAWRARLHEIIFEADTPAGKAFDVALLIAILLSVVAVALDSVDSLNHEYHAQLAVAEWSFTILFTVEYILRLVCVRRPWRYALSFFGIVDLMAILPTYFIVLMGPGLQDLVVIRALRLLRVFRVLKLARLLSEAQSLRRALWVSRGKVVVFLTTVLIVVAIMGTAMYLVEGKESPFLTEEERLRSPFTSIPQSMYWAIVTMTTVGYGDVVPVSTLGKTLTALITLIGYSMIIVPTGIIAGELARPDTRPISTQACPDCSREGHEIDAIHCKFCGSKL